MQRVLNEARECRDQGNGGCSVRCISGMQGV